MNRLLSGGATSQIATIIVLSLLAAHGLSALVWLPIELRRGPPLHDFPPEYNASMSQIGLVTRLLNALPIQDHEKILALSADSGLRFTEGTGTPPSPRLGGTRSLQESRHGTPAHSEQGDSTGEIYFPCPDGSQETFCAFLWRNTQDDSWILFRASPDIRRHGPPWFSPGSIASFVAFPILIAVMSLWAARRVTGPLVSLAKATEQVSILQDPNPVSEEGAREVRQVARAFNTVLERLQRFVANRTYMLASISHDLRTPLTRLKLRAETVNDPEIQMKMLSDIRTMEQMITATLAFIRDEAAHELTERVDIAVWLQTICHEFSDMGTNVEYDGPVHAAGSCRPEALKRAVVNLIDNAASFDASIVVRLAVHPDEFVVSVEDNGPGIPDAQKQKLLAPFVRNEAHRGERKGQVGLGLSIVESIVQSHNGRLELLDQAPRGLCVRLTIPAPQMVGPASGHGS